MHIELLEGSTGENLLKSLQSLFCSGFTGIVHQTAGSLYPIDLTNWSVIVKNWKETIKNLQIIGFTNLLQMVTRMNNKTEESIPNQAQALETYHAPV